MSAQDRWWHEELDPRFLELVESTLSATPRHYVEIADDIGAEPWDTLSACRELTRRGGAVEAGEERGKFLKPP